MAKAFELGRLEGLPEVRVVPGSWGVLPLPIVETRPTVLKTSLIIERLDNMDEVFWKAVAECVLVAIAGAAIAGLIPGGMASVPTFLHLLGTHAASKGIDLTTSQMRLHTETLYGEWKSLT